MTNRYQREIEEILEQVNSGDSATKTPVKRVPKQQHAPKPPKKEPAGGPGIWRFISPGKLLMAGLCLLLASLVVGSTIPGLGISGYLTIAGIILFVMAYLLFFIRPQRMERRWRGHSIEDTTEVTPLLRFWRWLNRK